MQNNSEQPLINSEAVENEVRRERYKIKFRAAFKSTLFTLVVVAAAAVLVATLWMPVLQIYGSSMTPALDDGEIVVSAKKGDYESGDIIAFYYNNKLLVKRVIATSSQWVNITEDGDVYIDGVLLDEPYVTEKAFGDCDIELPYQVPEGKVFVMGDHRSVSADSRNSVIGCVSEDEIVGKIMFRVWPFERIGNVK